MGWHAAILVVSIKHTYKRKVWTFVSLSATYHVQVVSSRNTSRCRTENSLHTSDVLSQHITVTRTRHSEQDTHTRSNARVVKNESLSSGYEKKQSVAKRRSFNKCSLNTQRSFFFFIIRAHMKSLIKQAWLECVDGNIWFWGENKAGTPHWLKLTVVVMKAFKCQWHLMVSALWALVLHAHHFFLPPPIVELFNNNLRRGQILKCQPHIAVWMGE